MLVVYVHDYIIFNIMKKKYFIPFILWLIVCNHFIGKSELIYRVAKTKNPAPDNTDKNKLQRKLSVLVLPPYDKIAGAGISPKVQQYIETALFNDNSLDLIKFPYKKLTGIPYQQIFDKKFCRTIMEKVKTDIIIMSKIEYLQESRNKFNRKWNLWIKIYNTNSGKQISSKVVAEKLHDAGIMKLLEDNREILIAEIKNTR